VRPIRSLLALRRDPHQARETRTVADETLAAILSLKGGAEDE
jgi:hypothetical protein